MSLRGTQLGPFTTPYTVPASCAVAYLFDPLAIQQADLGGTCTLYDKVYTTPDPACRPSATQAGCGVEYFWMLRLDTP